MSQLKTIVHRTAKKTKDHSPALLAALGISGTAITAYLTGKASFKAAQKLADEDPNLPTRQKLEIVWDLYIPPALCGLGTIVCIVGATRVSSKRAAAAQAAFALSERAYSEYRDKVVELVGDKKEQAIRDELAQDQVNRNPPPGNLVVTGPGQVLCMEAYTGRYFVSDMESLRKAQNDLNSRLIAHTYAYLDDLYGLLGLDVTSESNKLGWEADKQLELRFHAALSPDKIPCIVFEYNYVKPI